MDKKQLERKEETIHTMQQIIESQKEQLNSYQSERSVLERKFAQLQQQKLNDELSYENIVRRLKQELEKKQMEIEQMMNRFNSSEHGLMLLKLKNELEEPHQIELQFKSEQIAEQQSIINRMQQQMQIQNEKMTLMVSTHSNELQQLKEKNKVEQSGDRLQMRQMKEMNHLNQRDQEQIQELLREKEQLLRSLNQKDLQIKEARSTLEVERRNRDLSMSSLAQELDQERITKRKLQCELDNMEEAMQHLKNNAKEVQKESIKNETRTTDEDLRELQHRLNEYMNLFEQEKDQKRRLNLKLNDIIQQTKQEKLENDRIYETRIKELQEQLKEERNVKGRQQVRIKELQADLTEVKHELDLLKQYQQRIEEKERELASLERKILDRELSVHEREGKIADSRPLEQVEYENKKLKAKYKQAKQKLVEANQKILVLLTRVKDQQLDVEGQRTKVNRDVFKQKGYNEFYKLQEGADYLKDPYQHEQLDRISLQLREQLIESQFTINCLKAGKRVDGRDHLQYRDISCILGAIHNGGVELSIGDTRIFTTTNATITTPHPIRPSEGFLKFKVDLQILRDMTGVNPQKYCMEIEKYIERVLKGSKALDAESLCIQAGKSVWSIEVNTILINNDGNLIDACYLSTLISLLHFRRPQVKQQAEGLKIFTEQEKRLVPLSIHHIPLSLTYEIVSDETQTYLFIDPTAEEETIQSGRITLSTNVYNDICHIHKPGGCPILPDVMSKLMDVTLLKSKSITDQIRAFLESKNTFDTLKQRVQIYKFEMPKQSMQVEQQALEQMLQE